MKIGGVVTDDLMSNKGSSWSEVPPSPKALNEKMIWKSKLHEKNRVTRGENCAIGRLGQYIVGDPDKEHRLTDKLKAVTSRNQAKGMG